MEPTLDRKLKRRRMGSPEGRDDKIRGGRPGVRGLKGRERPVQTNEEVKRKMRHQNYLDRISSPTAGYMTGGQAKIAAKAPPPNKIDAKDFAVLRAEKAKGRGQGLQDEKMKPGKVMKAKMGKAVDYRKFLDGLKKATNEVNYNRAVMKRKAMEKAKDIGGFAKRAAKASKYGKIALGVAGIGLAAKEYLKTRKRKKKEEIAVRTLKEDMAVQKLKEGLPKKMGGGMMQRPMMGYKSGTMVKAKGCKLGRSKPTKLY